MIWQIVVVFDGLEGGRFAEQAKVMDGHAFRKKITQCYGGISYPVIVTIWCNGLDLTYHRPCLDLSARLERRILVLGLWSLRRKCNPAASRPTIHVSIRVFD